MSKILRECKADDGGIYPMAKKSDVYINGMFLNYANYFKADVKELKSVIDRLLAELISYGGFNC